MNAGKENETPLWICRYCGGGHQGVKCHLVKAIDYYPDGTKKRVEFLTPADCLQPMPANGLPAQLPGTVWRPAGPAGPAGPTCGTDLAKAHAQG